MVDLLGRGRMGVSAERLAELEEERRLNPRGWVGGAVDLLGGPSVASQMQGLDQAQRAALGRGGVRELMRDPQVAEQATDVASQLDLTGTFAGVRSPKAPLDMLGKATEMTEAGRAAPDIWRETGWWRAPDGKWRWEVDDSKAYLRGIPMSDIAEGRHQALPARRVLAHQDLFAAYPELEKTLVHGKASEGARGTSYGGSIGLAPGPRSKQQSTMLHEMQHEVQNIEDFARGGSPEMFAADHDLLRHMTNEATAAWQARNRVKYEGQPLVEATEFIANQHGLDPERLRRLIDEYPGEELTTFITSLETRKKKAEPFQRYRRLAGEAEARAVQKRADYTPELRREWFPGWDYDVPVDELIVRRR